MREFLQLYLRIIVTFFPIVIMLVGFVGLLKGLDLIMALQLVFVGVQIDNFNRILLSEKFEFGKLEWIDKLYMSKQAIFILLSLIVFIIFKLNIQELIIFIISSVIIDRLLSSKGWEYELLYWEFVGFPVRSLKQKLIKKTEEV